MSSTKTCSKCGEVKSRAEFSKKHDTHDGLQLACKDCCNTTRKKYYYLNIEKERERKRKYHRDHSEKTIKSAIKRKRKRLLTDPLFKFSHQLRAVITTSLKRAGARKKSRTEQLLGCTIAEFRAHLERQFVEDMSWENRSLWHIDHIIPMASAVTQEDAERLQHYTNLRPVWAKINLQEGDKGYRGTRAKAKKGTKHDKPTK